MSNQQTKSSKRKAKLRKRDEQPPRAATPVAKPDAPPQTQPGTNRAMRRAGTVATAAARATASEAPAQRSAKRYAVGPFTLFIGVVLVASIFSYLFIR